MSSLELDILDYKENASSLTAKQLAVKEHLLYEKHGGKGQVRFWLRDVLGGSSRPYEYRSTLLNAGEKADKYWAMLEDGETYSGVIRAFRSEKTSSPKASSCVTLTKRKNPEKSFRKDVGSFARFFAQQQTNHLSGLGKAKLEVAIVDFEILCEEAAKMLLRDLKKVKSTIKNNAITADQFSDACRMLEIDGEYGAPVDLRDAKRKMLKRARLFHPDRHNGSDQYVNQYQAVVQSYDILENYMKDM